MAAYNYLVPSILSFPSGVRCVLPTPWYQVGEQLIDGQGRVIYQVLVVRDGAVVEEHVQRVAFESQRPTPETPAPVSLESDSSDPDDDPAYIECSIRSEDGEPTFWEKSPLSFYSIYWAPGQKSYFSDNAWKYASPPVIQQIAEYGQYVDGYPVVTIDRDREVGMSLILINPYMKDIVSRVFAHDGRAPIRTKVPAMSARRVRLDELLRPDERRWSGQIQLTANNRLITYVTWHSLQNLLEVSDQEHLDPYRGEDTHIAAILQLRRTVGMLFQPDRGIPA